MDTINELNLHSCRTYFHKVWKSEHTRPVNLEQGHFQYRLKLLKIQNARDREIAMASLLGVQAMITLRILVRKFIVKARVFKGRTFAWREIKTEVKREGFYWEKNTENLTA